jgi:Lon-like protease
MINSDTGPMILPPPRPRRRLWWILAIVAAVLGATAALATVDEVPYYTVSPGAVWGTDAIVSVEGAPSYDSPGDVAFTTVTISSGRISRLERFLAGLDPAVEVVPEAELLGDDTPEENRERNLAFMADSQTTAIVVALDALGHDVARPTGARVIGVEQDLPAADILEEGDLIVGIDGETVTTWDEVVELIGARRPGDRVTVAIERPVSPDGPEAPPGPGEGDGLDEADGGGDREREPERERLTVSAVLAEADDPDEAGRRRPILGVWGETALEVDFPFEVTIDAGNVGGPSAGLAFTLAVLDALTPEDLTGGATVATTGTINLNGEVGAVGGIPQKTVAARRAGVELFLVPETVMDQALAVAGDLEVVGVADLADALAALERAGGDTRALQAAMAERTR